MLTKRVFMGCALCAAASLGAEEALTQGQPTPGRVSTRTEIRRVEYPADHVVLQVLNAIPAGVEFPRHMHPGVESAVVLDGELVLNVEGQPAQTYRRGDSFEVPPGAVHWGRGGTSDCRVFATYVVEKDKPLASPA
jgi:quercetin dioxygenase-like cupin family protein